MTRLYILLALCFCSFGLTAQVFINEICASNLAGLTDGDGDHEDWFELYNAGGTSVNLSGWFISDDPMEPQKWKIPTGQNIAAGGYRMVFCSGKDKIQGTSLHTNFKLTQTQGESIVLTKSDGTTMDTYTFTIPNQTNHSYGRKPNGSANWKVFTTPTPGVTNSTTAYNGYAPAVVASQDGGFYPGSVSVSLSTDPGFTIRYTTDGSEPIGSSTLYAAPININTTKVLKAAAFTADPQLLTGFVTYHTYFINVNHTVPVVSIAGNTVSNLMAGGYITPTGSFEYYENNELKADGYGEYNKHGNDSWAYAQRGIDWITRDQMGYDNELNYRIFKDRPRKKFQRLILKAAANDNYPASNGGAHIRDSYVHTLALHGGLNVDVRTHRSAVLYVNGQYWGVYDIREKADDADYTKYYYDQDEFDIDYIKTWGNTWEEYGSWTDWYTLKNFILGNNMTNAANYAIAEQQLDFLSLIDYIIINQHSVCKDWLNWNTAWWRGRNPDGTAKKWRYALWDMDATFGHYVNYTGIPDVGPTADPCDVEQIPNSGDPQNHIDIFMALYANPQFKALYVNRYADLLNTSLSCTYMNALLDSMINVITPEMPQQCTKWGGTMAGWNQNVQALHDFINTRCQILEPSIVNCYDVTGPYNLTVKISPASSPNHVKVNTIIPPTYPYVGEYFGDINIALVAQPEQGWLFDHWEVAGNTFTPNQLSAAIALAFQTSGMVTAFFVEVAPCLPPTDIAVSTVFGTTVLDWTDQTLAMNYPFKYRKEGETTWTQVNSLTSSWDFDVLPGCTTYEVQIQTACPQSTSDSVDYSFTTTDYLQGFALADAEFCNTAGTMLDATFSGASYEWNDGTTASTLSVDTPGDYWVTVELDGCVLTDTAQVTQLTATGTAQPVLCPTESFTLGGETFNAQNPSGEVLLANMAANGCDSLVQVNLTFLVPDETYLQATSCNPASVGVDTVILANLVGCDSLVITTTTFDASAISITNLAAQNCDPTMVGVDTLVLTSLAGCDSLVITTTTLALTSQTNLTAASCNPSFVGIDTLVLSNFLGCDSLVITNTTFDASAISITNLATQNCDPAMVGMDTLILTSLGGCDSLVITTTTLALTSQTNLTTTSCNPSFVGVDTIILSNFLGCDSLVVTNTTFDASAISITNLSAHNCDPSFVGIDTLVLTSLAGCDSLVITTTTLAPTSQTNLSATSCNPSFVGVDTLMLSNFFGCDSLVITNTTFDASAISITNLAAKNCDPALVGVDTLVLTSLAGCDSLVITTTTLAPTSQTNLTATTCNPSFVGIDTLVLSNFFGCDSLVITATSFDASAISITNLTALNCDPTLVGVDTLVLSSLAGCDSLVITNTTLAPTSQTLLTAASCDLATVGTDTLVLANQFGCDSLVITNTSFVGFDFEVSQEGVGCVGDDDGMIRLDTTLTDLLPVEFMMEGQASQSYTGTPLAWEGLPAGVYLLMAVNLAGCIVTQEIAVADAFPLQLDFAQAPLQLHIGDSIWVNPQANFQIETALWSPVDGVNCPTCPATYLAAQKTRDYTLTASDANGCSTSTSLTVEVDESVRVYVPTAIRPGGDGFNTDFIVFAGPEVAMIRSLRLFDRWGDVVFEQYGLAPNLPSNWDGTYRGKLIQTGVLVWLAVVETIDGRVVNLSGDITVLR